MTFMTPAAHAMVLGGMLTLPESWSFTDPNVTHLPEGCSEKNTWPTSAVKAACG